jgi:hypothetical protein
MSKRDKKFVTQEIFNALSSTSKTAKTTQFAFDLSASSRKKLRIEAAMDDMSPSDKARQALGLTLNIKKVKPKLILNLTEDDFKFLAEKYEIDPSDKLAIRTKAAEQIISQYSED